MRIISLVAGIVSAGSALALAAEPTGHVRIVSEDKGSTWVGDAFREAVQQWAENPPSNVGSSCTLRYHTTEADDQVQVSVQIERDGQPAPESFTVSGGTVDAFAVVDMAAAKSRAHVVRDDDRSKASLQWTPTSTYGNFMAPIPSNANAMQAQSGNVMGTAGSAGWSASQKGAAGSAGWAAGLRGPPPRNYMRDPYEHRMMSTPSNHSDPRAGDKTVRGRGKNSMSGPGSNKATDANHVKPK